MFTLIKNSGHDTHDRTPIHKDVDPGTKDAGEEFGSGGSPLSYN